MAGADISNSPAMSPADLFPVLRYSRIRLRTGSESAFNVSWMPMIRLATFNNMVKCIMGERVAQQFCVPLTVRMHVLATIS